MPDGECVSTFQYDFGITLGHWGSIMRLAVVMAFVFVCGYAKADVIVPTYTNFQTCVPFQLESEDATSTGIAALKMLFGIENPVDATERASIQIRSKSESSFAQDWQRLRLIRDNIQQLRPTIRSIQMLLTEIVGEAEWKFDCPNESVLVGFTFISTRRFPEICEKGRFNCWVVCSDSTCSFQKK